MALVKVIISYSEIFMVIVMLNIWMDFITETKLTPPTPQQVAFILGREIGITLVLIFH